MTDQVQCSLLHCQIIILDCHLSDDQMVIIVTAHTKCFNGCFQSQSDGKKEKSQFIQRLLG